MHKEHTYPNQTAGILLQAKQGMHMDYIQTLNVRFCTVSIGGDKARSCPAKLVPSGLVNSQSSFTCIFGYTGEASI